MSTTTNRDANKDTSKKGSTQAVDKTDYQNNTLETKLLVNNEDYPLWRVLMMENLTPFGLQEIVEETFDPTTYKSDIAKEHLKCLQNNFAPILCKFLQTLKGIALICKDNSKPDKVWKAHHEFQTGTTHANSLARDIFKTINNSCISDRN